MHGVKVAICMPVFNEGDGIRDFIDEIVSNFKKHEFKILVVDDFSTDNTEQILIGMQSEFPLVYSKNEINLGHGPSTIRSLKMALEGDFDYVVAVDGDGQFLAGEMLTLLENTVATSSEVGLGVRIREKEPFYRVTTSWITRLLVTSKTKSRTKDANTPLRIYKMEILREILSRLKEDNPIPNLYVSAFIAKSNLSICSTNVIFRTRRGISSQSTSWGKSSFRLPSRRYIKFCLTSLIYWVRN